MRSPSIQLYFSLCLSKPFLNADVSRNHVNYMTASIFVEKVKFSISFCFKVDLIQTKFYFNHASIFADVRIIFLSNLAIIDWFVGLWFPLVEWFSAKNVLEIKLWMLMLMLRLVCCHYESWTCYPLILVVLPWNLLMLSSRHIYIVTLWCAAFSAEEKNSICINTQSSQHDLEWVWLVPLY